MENLIGIIMAGIMLGFFVLWFTMYCIFFLFVIFSIVFWVLMIVDVAKRDFKKEDEKITWILVVALTGVIGALIYYFSVKRPEDKKKKPSKNKVSSK